MTDVYQHCPVLCGPSLTLRLVAAGDAKDLLQVYGNPANVPYYNSDNCHGDTFYYPTPERMQQAVTFWLNSYAWKYFVRWSILENGRAIGTVECFRRDSDGSLPDCALLRIDLRHDRHTAAVNNELLDLLLPRLPEYFGTPNVAIKAPPVAHARIECLTARGFTAAAPLIGDDGTHYPHYWLYQPSIHAKKKQFTM